MKYAKSIGGGLLATLSVVGMLTSSSLPAAAAEQSDTSTFAMYIIDDHAGFDPALFGWDEVQCSIGIYEGLVVPGAKGPKPGIATSWSSNKDKTVWTFKLRKNAEYSNGDPIKAGDFVYSWRRAADPVTATQEGGGSAIIDVPILNLQDIRSGDKAPSALGVKALDDYTFQVRLSKPDPTIVQDLAMWSSIWNAPMDQKAVKHMFRNDWTNPAKVVSDGPYMLQSYKSNVQATLVPNPHYYGKVSLKQITLYYNSANDLMAFKNGQMDAALLTSSDLAGVKADPSLSQQLHMADTSVQYTFEIGSGQNQTLQNPLVRKAFAMAIDRDAISQKVLQGAGTPAYDYYSPTWMDPWIKKGAVKYDPTEAKKLLAQAGFPNGKGFPELHILVGTTTDLIAEATQQMLQTNLGIKVKFDGEEWGKFTTDRTKIWPADQVALVQASANSKAPQLVLPANFDKFVSSSILLLAGYLPTSAAEQWQTLSKNQVMDPVERHNKVIALFQKNLPKNVLDWINLGIKAYNTGDQKLTQQFFLQHEQSVMDFPIYTPVQPLLIRSDVKGYNINHLLLTAPPLWLNDITRG